MKVGNFAGSNPVALRDKENLAAAAATFLKQGIDGAPVIDEKGRIVGILTKTHLYRAIVQVIPFDQEIGVSMKRDVKTILADRPMEEAWQMACEFNIGRRPLVAQAGRLVAMMTRTDLVKASAMLYQNLDAIINSSYDGIVVVDGHSDPVRYNEASTAASFCRKRDLSRNFTTGCRAPGRWRKSWASTSPPLCAK